MYTCDDEWCVRTTWGVYSARSMCMFACRYDFFFSWETPLIDCTYELMATSIHLMFIPSLSLHAYNRDSCGYSRQPCDSVCGARLLHDARVCAHGSRFSSSTTLVWSGHSTAQSVSGAGASSAASSCSYNSYGMYTSHVLTCVYMIRRCIV